MNGLSTATTNRPSSNRKSKLLLRLNQNGSNQFSQNSLKTKQIADRLRLASEVYPSGA